MTNPWRGEVAVTVDGATFDAKLTLGALVELEAELEERSLVGLVERFETGRFAARDILAVLSAGLQAGGWPGTSRDLAAADIAGGPVEAARVAGALLSRAFELPG